MSALKIVAISGSSRRPSRTAALVGAALSATTRRLQAGGHLIELAEVGPVLFSAGFQAPPGAAAAAVLHEVETADALIVGTPVYRGSYTGVLKHLFDLVHKDSLRGTPVLLAATAGTPLHGLVLEHQLRPLLGFFGALTVPTTLFATEDSFRDHAVADPALVARIERAADELAALIEAVPARRRAAA